MNRWLTHALLLRWRAFFDRLDFDFFFPTLPLRSKLADVFDGLVVLLGADDECVEYGFLLPPTALIYALVDED